MAANKPEIEVGVSADSSTNGDARDGLHFVRRGETVDEDAISEDIAGYDAERMKARTSLTFEEEKKLLRRIDWHIMPLVSIMFLLKNIDYANVSRIDSL